VTAVRPPILPPLPTPPGAARPEPGRAAAQKAFFDMALGKAAAAPPTPAAMRAATPPTAAAPRQRLPDPAAEKPQKILRPGSLLDIRV
jgi:hypothetical protein